nr:receptor-like protein 12 [Ipomoea trifida]
MDNVLPSPGHWTKPKARWLKQEAEETSYEKYISSPTKVYRYNLKLGPTGSRTQVAGFKVQSANHYTIEPMAKIFGSSIEGKRDEGWEKSDGFCDSCDVSGGGFAAICSQLSSLQVSISTFTSSSRRRDDGGSVSAAVMELCICGGSGVCRNEEKQALLCFKNESKVPTNWVDTTDCCSEWDGVVCDNVTGHVVELRPVANNLGAIDNWLEVIDMLPSVRELYLRGCGLSNLSHPLHNSSSLQVLDLSGNRFNSVIPRWMFNLNNLVSLDLSQCGFLGSFPNGPWNLTYLSSLDLSLNEMNGSLPNQLFGLSYMKSLKLCCNQFHGPLPNDRWNLTSLEVLDVSSNYLNSHIPDSIYHCPNLKVLRLRGNNLQGIISKSISNLTYLSTLVISSNMLTGEIPKEIGKLKNLNVFLFSSNKFYGPLPESIGYLSSLTTLSFLNNKLEGIVTENHFVNLTMLTEFYASGNRLTLKVRPNWMPPFQLYALALSGWNLGPQFPIWLQSQHQIVQLEISNAEIEGEIPKWFWNFSSVLEAIDLSFNQLQVKFRTSQFVYLKEV